MSKARRGAIQAILLLALWGFTPAPEGAAAAWPPGRSRETRVCQETLEAGGGGGSQ